MESETPDEQSYRATLRNVNQDSKRLVASWAKLCKHWDRKFGKEVSRSLQESMCEEFDRRDVSEADVEDYARILGEVW